jgi:hypothetical protein
VLHLCHARVFFGKNKPFKQDMFVKHMENEIPNAKCSVITGNDGYALSTIPVSIMMYSYSTLLPVDVHDKSRENVVGLGSYKNISEYLNGYGSKYPYTGAVPAAGIGRILLDNLQ